MTSTCPSGHPSEADDYCDVCGAPMGAAPSTGAVTPPAGPGAGPAGGGAVPGSPLDLGPYGAGAPAGGPPNGLTCPNCSAANVPGALFCENCGYDFTTGQLPRLDPPRLMPPAGYGSGPGGSVQPGVGPGVRPTPPPLPPPPLPPPTGGGPGTMPPGLQGPVEWVAEVWIDPDWHAAQDVNEPCPSPGMPLVVPLHGTSQLIGRRSVSRSIHPQIDCGADTGVSRRHAQLTTDGQRWWVEDLQSSNGTFIGTTGGPLPDVPVPVGQRTELPDDARLYVGAWTRIVVRPATADERSAAG